MKLEEIPKSTKVRKFSNGDMLLTLWFNGSHCKSMGVLICFQEHRSCFTNIKSHYYDAENEVRCGYELLNVNRM